MSPNSEREHDNRRKDYEARKPEEEIVFFGKYIKEIAHGYREKRDIEVAKHSRPKILAGAEVV